MTFPKSNCPYCGNESCEADWVDIGVGYEQCSPYHCDHCHAFEISAYDTVDVSEDERRVGWYKPGRIPETVNSIDGVAIDTETALAMYRKGLVDQVPFQITTPAAKPIVAVA